MPHFPLYRPRRLRKTETIRNLLRETSISIKNLVYPMFVIEGKDLKNPIPSLPGVYQLSSDRMLVELEEVVHNGIPAIMLFGIPAAKDPIGSSAFDPNGVVQNAVRKIKHKFPDLLVVTDVCLCEYTDHGHCGVVKNGEVLNDPTLEILAQTALSHVQAGADVIAPSDMMDGRVKSIRHCLDQHGFENTPLMSYSAKYASGFYGPFRDAAGSAPQFGDRKSYQMDPANWEEALREVQLDIEEGADIIMVKPALSYLDIIRLVKDKFHYPVACYNVSGEYAMVKAAAQNGWIDEQRVVLEILTGLRRAGADIIITYSAVDVARWLNY